MPAKRRNRGDGTTRRLPSGRWQARFYGPDGERRSAPVTFDTKLDAAAWLAAEAREVDRGVWQRPVAIERGGGKCTLRSYSDLWLAARDLKPRTRSLYRDLLDALVLPGLGEVTLDRLSPTTVRNWHATLDPGTPTRRAHAYSLLRAIMSTAASDDLVPANPCRIRGAGAAKKKHTTTVATLGELELIVETMPSRYQAMVLLAAWCGLRFGELAELRRSDIDLARGYLRVDRGVTRAGGQIYVGDPKSQAGRRRVSIPPHLIPILQTHLDEHTGSPAGALLFSARGGGHLAPTTLHRVWKPAREAAGRPDLTFHDLRHTGATLAAAAGATLADLMARLGHSTPSAALHYQHVAADRDYAIAAALSGFAEGNQVPLRLVR